MRFSAIRYALRNRNSSSTGAVIDPRSFFQSIPLSPLLRRLPWVISMGESAMKFKVKHEERRRRTLSENNAFGYFGHTSNALPRFLAWCTNAKKPRYGDWGCWPPERGALLA